MYELYNTTCRRASHLVQLLLHNPAFFGLELYYHTAITTDDSISAKEDSIMKGGTMKEAYGSLLLEINLGVYVYGVIILCAAVATTLGWLHTPFTINTYSSG